MERKKARSRIALLLTITISLSVVLLPGCSEAVGAEGGIYAPVPVERTQQSPQSQNQTGSPDPSHTDPSDSGNTGSSGTVHPSDPDNAGSPDAGQIASPVSGNSGSHDSGQTGSLGSDQTGSHDNEQTVDEFRGVWVSTVINLDYPSKPGLPVSELKAEALSILDNCAAMGFNAVILQVRPAGDAFYKSDLFPWSQYLTGTQGKAPGDDFDPLEFWVEEAHARGLELHAWINPYRVARLTHDLTSLSESNFARRNPDWVVKHKDGHMYYNPGIPAVRQLIIDGVAEIVENYDVDGIHFDDYFYPDKDFEDSDTYKKFGGDYGSIQDWRRANIDKLIEETYNTVKAIDPDVRFGVSPFGIWANKSSNPLGSATNGNQSYYSHFADSRKWVLNGWLDYICPQLYWNIGYNIADYEVLLNWWANVVRGTDVDLYVGHASYRCSDEDPSSPWYGTSELRRQLNMNAATPEVKGSVHFRYSFFLSYAPLGRFITNYYSDMELPSDYPVMPSPGKPEGIVLGRPTQDISTTYSKMYVIGRCDPEQPLYLNGKEVENITTEGYFGIMVSLDVGKNVLTFTQGESTLVRTISRSASSSAAEPLKKSVAEIVEGSTYPHVYNVYITPGEKITFRCTAPIGADVTVTLAGKTYKLYPAATKSPGTDAIYYTNYSYTYTMPETSETGKVIVIGTPVYKMTYKGKTVTSTATGDLRCITPGAPYYARVKTDNAFIYQSSSTSGGPIGELRAGMVDYITAVTSSGTWVRLGMGAWIKREDVERFNGDKAFVAGISNPVYTVGEKWDRLQFSVTDMPVAKVSFSDPVLTLTISSAGALPALKIPKGSLIAAYSSSLENGNAVYRLTLDKGAKLDGYYIDAEFGEGSSGTLFLYLKRRPKASSSVTKPLEGFTIMIDPGHGGSDNGALGPLGTAMPEKNIALYAALKVKYELEALGAKVLMTRTGDEAVTLEERLNMSRSAKPDLFLSIHNNAVDVNVDATSILGVSTWYMRGISYDFAQELVTYLATELGRNNRRANSSSLYVCRGTWSPSVILEAGFICSPAEFEWLSNDESQTELARSIARAIVQYFS